MRRSRCCTDSAAASDLHAARRAPPMAAPDSSIAIPRLGIPAIQMADSAYGVTRGANMGRYSTALPNNLAAASSWDPQMVFEYGALIGRELRDQGYSMSLGGGVNLPASRAMAARSSIRAKTPCSPVRWSGNSPKACSPQHIIGDLKHYALNDQESGRNAVNANIDKRSMRETDLRAFEIALAISDAGGVMCSYNRVNGDVCVRERLSARTKC